eukprot:905066-Rhodomonas_salina.1
MSTRHAAMWEDEDVVVYHAGIWEDKDVEHLRKGVVYRHSDLKRRRSAVSALKACKKCKPELYLYNLPVLEVGDATFTDLDVYNKRIDDHDKNIMKMDKQMSRV